MTSIYRDTLIVLDVIKGQTALINMDSLAYSKGYSPKIIQSGESESNIGLIPYKGSLLRLNPYCFRSPDGEIDNHDHRRFIPPSDETLSDRDYDYLTHNVSQGTLVANPDKNKIVFCREYENIVEIYEYSSLRKIMEISGPCDFGNSFQVYSNRLGDSKRPSPKHTKGGSRHCRLVHHHIPIRWNGLHIHVRLERESAGILHSGQRHRSLHSVGFHRREVDVPGSVPSRRK